MNPIVIMIRGAQGSRKHYHAYFKKVGHDNSYVGYGVGRNPQDAVTALMQHEIGLPLISKEGMHIRVEWEDPVEEVEWDLKTRKQLGLEPA